MDYYIQFSYRFLISINFRLTMELTQHKTPAPVGGAQPVQNASSTSSTQLLPYSDLLSSMDQLLSSCDVTIEDSPAGSPAFESHLSGLSPILQPVDLSALDGLNLDFPLNSSGYNEQNSCYSQGNPTTSQALVKWLRTCMKTECVIRGTTGGLINPNYCYKISWAQTRLVIKLAGQTYKSTFFSAVEDISLYYVVSKLGDPPISPVRFSLPRLNRVHCFARARCKVWSKENVFFTWYS